MASGNEGVALERKRTIVSALCKHRSVDATKFLDDVGNDLKSLSFNIMKTAYENNKEWVTFAENFPLGSEACITGLSQLNEYLSEESVLVGGGYTPCDADIIVFSTVHSYVIDLPKSETDKLPHLMRWMDYIQSTHDLKELLKWIELEKAPFEPPLEKTTSKVEADLSAKKAVSDTKKAASNAKKAVSDTKKAASNAKAAGSGADTEKESVVSKKQATGNTEAATDKKKLPEKVPDDKDKDLSVSLLKIQVGLIRKASKHPSADSLLVEEIDVGEGKCRQVVSGLAKFCTPEELTNRLVALITNVKPGKLRDVVSEGLVLCASNADHTAVEPLIVPEGAKIGEHVAFSGHEGKPEDVLNPKKKQLDKITPNLFTDDKGVATFKGIPFMTSAGPCTSTITNASIK